MTPSQGIEPGPHWWEASALITAPSPHPKKLILGTLRSTTATSSKTSPQYMTLLYHKSFAVILSRSLPTIWAKYPYNKLLRAVKIEKERFSVACSRCRQNLKFGNFTSSLCWVPQESVLKSVLHVQRDHWCSFNQWYHCFSALLGPSPSWNLKLPNLGLLRLTYKGLHFSGLWQFCIISTMWKKEDKRHFYWQIILQQLQT